MTMLIIDPICEALVLEDRRAIGADRHDEVWDGVYVVPPIADNEHQQIGARLTSIYDYVLGWSQTCQIRLGTNVSDQAHGWRKNYRCPDVAVFLARTKARNKRTHWLGGPDHAVEVISPDDRTRDKLPFYEKVGTREVLLVDRDPWALELYRLRSNRLKLVGKCTLAKKDVLQSSVLPLTYTLVPAKPRPKIQVTHRQTGQKWLV